MVRPAISGFDYKSTFCIVLFVVFFLFRTSKGVTMNIEYRIKNVYGSDLKYPVSKDAVLACALNGSKTLTDSAITIIKEVYPNSTFNQVL